MVKCLVSVRDSKVGYFDTRCVDSTELAKRDFYLLFSAPDVSALAKFPQDYNLFLVGYFDTETGLVTQLSCPEHIASGMDASDYWVYLEQAKSVDFKAQEASVDA